jgi:hypothetical protein
LEVILALAILAGAIAVLSEVSGIGMRNAQLARDLTHAQLLCESKMSEIVAGLETPQVQEGVPLGTTDDPAEADWLYSVQLNSTAQEGLLEIRVRVYKDLPTERHPVEFSLVRWIVDPNAQSSETTGGETDSQSAGNSATSQNGGEGDNQ